MHNHHSKSGPIWTGGNWEMFLQTCPRILERAIGAAIYEHVRDLHQLDACGHRSVRKKHKN